MMLRKVVLFTLFMILSACAREKPIAQKLDLAPQNGQIDLAGVLSNPWDRVCIIAPYSYNEDVQTLLGTELNIEARSRIDELDNISLLVTLQGDRVTGLFEVPRGSVDFAHLGKQCFPREKSTFTVPTKGHPQAIETDP